jgi:hypothetical protein
MRIKKIKKKHKNRPPPMRCCFDILTSTCYCKFVYLIVASLEGVRVSYLSAQEGLLSFVIFAYGIYV